ncbi:MAG: polysaccharide deacetylase family protein [Thermoplasmata archaeon]
MYFLATNDVEVFSLAKNREDPNMTNEIYKIGIPRLLEVYSKYDVEATFYYTGNIVEIKPEVVDIVKAHGHEVGCHSYSHANNEMLDILSYEEQYRLISKAKKIIEEAAGPIVSFRAPELRINSFTIKALEKCGFKTDSSISPQRFDGPLSFGTKRKMMWLISHREAYFPSNTNPYFPGSSKVLEIPLSSLIFPYIGATMGIWPGLFKMIEKLLFFESKRSWKKPICFIIHPGEVLDYKDREKFLRESSVKAVVGDVFRQNLKLRYTGKMAVKLLEETLKRAKSDGFHFVSAKRYYTIFKEG